MSTSDRTFAASHGEPSYVWRAGQDRRLDMIVAAVPTLASDRLLEVGCGVGVYLQRLGHMTAAAVGVEYEPGRAHRAAEGTSAAVIVGANEWLPFPDASFDVVLSNEVIEHVHDDHGSAAELVRVLRPGGRLVLFCPNRWYPVEQHGIYWRGKYRFGNIPLVNYLPDPWRNHLAPHVRVYTRRGLEHLFDGLPVHQVAYTRIFGAYDNVIARFGKAGVVLRRVLHRAERTPLNVLGLSHVLVLERDPDN